MRDYGRRASRERSTQAPFTDRASRAANDDAIAALAAERADDWPGDIAVEIHVLASLRLQLETDLRAAISSARQHGYRWPDIAELLGLTTKQARSRYDHSSTTPP